MYNSLSSPLLGAFDSDRIASCQLTSVVMDTRRFSPCLLISQLQPIFLFELHIFLPYFLPPVVVLFHASPTAFVDRWCTTCYLSFLHSQIFSCLFYWKKIGIINFSTNTKLPSIIWSNKVYKWISNVQLEFAWLPKSFFSSQDDFFSPSLLCVSTLLLQAPESRLARPKMCNSAPSTLHVHWEMVGQVRTRPTTVHYSS